MRDVSRALLAIRKFHGVKQGELSESLGVSSSYLCEIEKGRKNINLELLKKYSDYFDIPVSSILFLSERMDFDTGQAGSFRVKAAGLLLKILEWSAPKEQNDE